MTFCKKVPKILGTFCLLIFFACKQNFKRLSKHYQEQVLETEARCTDIAIPLGITNFRTIELGFEYSVALSLADLNKFYDESMELYGWQILTKSKNINIYEKPHKLSIIEIQALNKLLNVKIRSVAKCGY
jgi:hypothetical protein